MGRMLLLVALLLASRAQAQEIGTKNTIPMPANGTSGGTNAAIWKAECKPGMVMTGIQIVVGGTCHHQCDADGRPMTGYRILCSELSAGKS